MAQVALGDRQLLGTIVRRHAQPLLTFLTRMSGDSHHAEDLFQDVFLALWTKRHLYQYPRPFRPWLYAIAVNRCRARYRLRSPSPLQWPEDGPGPADSSRGPDEEAMALDSCGKVAEAVARLPEQQRAVVSLRVWQDLPYARIAEIVGCTESTVRSHMHHALASLREALDPILHGAPKGPADDH
jgi:RNA polymerase sigma-70 factor (ECF subfamily)